MNEVPPFKDIKLQWIELLLLDDLIRDSSKILGTILALKYINRKDGIAWPSIETLAKDLGDKSQKTIKRAVDDLTKNQWFELIKGGGRGHTTRYLPCAHRILAAYC